jgi:hypothetical protein
MEAIWADMKHTELPSWVTDVPHNWGTATCGKLSANNWRVIYTVHLPITLIRLWGVDDAPEDRKRKLENFMDLVRAVQIANLRSISKNDIEQYESFVYRDWVQNLIQACEGETHTSHGLALRQHPLRFWTCAHPWSRILRTIYTFHATRESQHEARFVAIMSTFAQGTYSCQSGELELTFMHSSAREAKLQALLFDHGEVREHVDELAKTYQAFLAEDTHGTRLAHMIEKAQLTQQLDFIFEETCLHDMILPDAVLLPFLQFLHQKHASTTHSTDRFPGLSVLPRAKFLDKFSFRGVQYSTASSRTRNSRVLLRPPKLDSSESLANPEAGQIIHAFLHSQINTHRALEDEGRVRYSSICLCIQPYVPVQPELGDVDKSYRRFGFAGGFLSAQTLGPPVIVDTSSIISHVAVMRLNIRGYGVLHVLPMDRVSCLPLISRAESLMA